MDFKRRLTALSEDVKASAKELLYRTVNPEIDFYVGKDGFLHGKGKGFIGFCFQRTIDHHCKRTENLKVIAKKNGGNVYSLYHPSFPSLAGKRAVEARIREVVFKIRTPTTNTMAITYKCQCKCVHCSADVKVDPTRKELTTEEWKKVIDDSCEIGVYNHVITGGEPCLRKDLPEIISHVTPEKGTVLLFTNGVLLKKRARELANAGLYAVNISIDDINPDVHNQLRKMNNCYEMAMEGAAALRELGVLTGISTYATKEKLKNGELEKLIDMATRDGFHEVTIFDPVPSGKWMRDTSYLLNDEERKYLQKLTLDSRKIEGGPVIIAQSYINSPLGNGCFGGYLQFYTTAYGDVNPCDFNPVAFGNVREDKGLKKAWTRMTQHSEYRHKRPTCRMQNPEYRKKYIDPVPDGVIWPVPIEYYENKDASRVKHHRETKDHHQQLHQY